MLKVSEVASECGVTASAIYKVIRRVDNETVDGHTSVDNETVDGHTPVDNDLWTVDNGKTMITPAGLQYFKDRFGVQQDNPTDPDPSPATPADTGPASRTLEVLEALLEEKDRSILRLQEQLAAKDAQIQNLHVLLRLHVDKVPQLEAPKQKRSFWDWLLGRKSSEPPQNQAEDQN